MHRYTRRTFIAFALGAVASHILGVPRRLFSFLLPHGFTNYVEFNDQEWSVKLNHHECSECALEALRYRVQLLRARRYGDLMFHKDGPCI
jgi:hypothetical protein